MHIKSQWVRSDYIVTLYSALLCSNGIGTVFFFSFFFRYKSDLSEIESTFTYKTQRSSEEELVRGGGGGGGGGGIFAQLLPFVGFLVSILGEPGIHIFFFYLLFCPCVLCGGEFHNCALVVFSKDDNGEAPVSVDGREKSVG